MYNVNILPSAWENLKSIEDYYAIQFDADTAIKVVNSILDAIERLEERAAEYDGKLMLDGEYDWGDPVGREIW